MVSPARLLVSPIPIAMTAAPTFSLHPDRFFDAEPSVRRAARTLYEEMRGLPLICPHGHVDPSLLSEDRAFPEPAALLITPDHYLFRMLYSQGVSMESLGVPTRDPKTAIERDPRKVWRIFAANYHLFRGTPSRAWLDHRSSMAAVAEVMTDTNAWTLRCCNAGCTRRRSLRQMAPLVVNRLWPQTSAICAALRVARS